MKIIAIQKKVILTLLLSLNICFFSLSSIFAEISDVLKVQKAQVALTSDYNPAKPAKNFKIGVFFNLMPNWHIYWKNPGEFGKATKVQFKLPAGYQVSQIKWPKPERFKQYAGKIGYGYEYSVLLWADVTNTSKNPNDILRPSDIQASVSWLNCSEKLCAPQFENIILDSFYAEASNEAMASSAEVPTLVNSLDNNLFNAKIAHIASKNGTDSNLLLELDFPSKVTNLEFFPNLPIGYKVVKETIQNKDKDLRGFYSVQIKTLNPAKYSLNSLLKQSTVVVVVDKKGFEIPLFLQK